MTLDDLDVFTGEFSLTAKGTPIMLDEKNGLSIANFEQILVSRYNKKNADGIIVYYRAVPKNETPGYLEIVDKYFFTKENVATEDYLFSRITSNDMYRIMFPNEILDKSGINKGQNLILVGKKDSIHIYNMDEYLRYKNQMASRKIYKQL